MPFIYVDKNIEPHIVFAVRQVLPVAAVDHREDVADFPDLVPLESIRTCMFVAMEDDEKVSLIIATPVDLECRWSFLSRSEFDQENIHNTQAASDEDCEKATERARLENSPPHFQAPSSAILRSRQERCLLTSLRWPFSA